MSHYTIEKEDYSTLDKNISIAIITAQFNKNFTDQLELLNKDFFIQE
jgi:6,7-dimethyl-8-ribityllumazine synthase